LDDNISANVVGVALGTLFRFWSYRRFVFAAAPERLSDSPRDRLELSR
jgi:putative flippase GtrA